MTKEEIGELVRRYQAGESSIQLAKAFGCSKPTALKYIGRAGVGRRSISDAKRRDGFNEAAFDCINEESAYWIGLLMADGCVHYPRVGTSPRVSLSLHSGDVSHIERFKAFLNTSAKVYKYKNKSMVELVVTSRRLAEALALYGVTPRKSLTAKVSGLQRNRDFWRGVVDGDGSVARSTSALSPLQLCGSYDLMTQFASFVHSVVGVAPTPYKRGNLYIVKLYNNTAYCMLEVLYSGCTVALPRKEQNAQQFIQRRRDVAGRRDARKKGAAHAA